MKELNCIKGDYFFCEMVNSNVPSSFCNLICKGDWFNNRRLTAGQWREKIRNPITDCPDGLISIIIPVRHPDEQYLERTIQSVRDNAVGEIEIIVVYDGVEGPQWTDAARVITADTPRGHRWCMNRGAEAANGKYLFRLDCHCALDKEWDARLKLSCPEQGIIKPVIDALDEMTWQGKGNDFAFARLDDGLRWHWIKPYIEYKDRTAVEETMAIAGCAYFLTKDYYQKIGGCDEDLGGFGAAGPEMSIKTWLTGGSVLVRTDIACSHLFRSDGKIPYGILSGSVNAAYKKLYEKWVLNRQPNQIYGIQWLKERFQKMLNRSMFTLGGKDASLRVQVQ